MLCRWCVEIYAIVDLYVRVRIPPFYLKGNDANWWQHLVKISGACLLSRTIKMLSLFAFYLFSNIILLRDLNIVKSPLYPHGDIIAVHMSWSKFVINYAISKTSFKYDGTKVCYHYKHFVAEKVTFWCTRRWISGRLARKRLTFNTLCLSNILQPCRCCSNSLNLS